MAHRTVNGIELKQCSRCKEWLSLDNFYAGKVWADGLQSICKACKKRIAQETADRVNEISRQTYARHKEEYLQVRATRRSLANEGDIVHDDKFQKRYWAKVIRGDGCWEWNAFVNKNGYGQIGFRGALVYAHRAAWTLANGPIPDGLFVCHKCDNRKCCNPEHMFLGTFEDNMNDKVQKGRQARPIGEKSPTSKLTWEQVREIRERYKNETIMQSVLAKEYGVSASAISHVITNRTWIDKDYVP